jgi:predicted DNA-binding transcriptional regulator AlpA
MVDSMAEPGYTPADVERLVVLVKIAVHGGLFRQGAAKAMVRALRVGLSVEPRQMPDRLLRTDEVADRLAVCKKSVFRMAEAGRLPRLYLSPRKAKSLRFRESDVDAIIAGIQGSTEDA